MLDGFKDTCWCLSLNEPKAVLGFSASLPPPPFPGSQPPPTKLSHLHLPAIRLAWVFIKGLEKENERRISLAGVLMRPVKHAGQWQKVMFKK